MKSREYQQLGNDTKEILAPYLDECPVKLGQIAENLAYPLRCLA